MSLPDDLAAPLAREWPRIAPLVSDIRWLPETPSTMDAVQERGTAVRGGTVVVADAQTAGRGRRGRTWVSPPGAGLYFSLLLRPPVEAPPAGEGPSLLGLLTLAAGVALADGVAEATGLRLELKWPNDALVGKRKLAGILAEGLGIGTTEQAVVLGMGIDIRAGAYPPDVAARATSLETELGRAVDRGEVLASVLAALAGWYRMLVDARYDAVLTAWRALAPSASGASVAWQTPHGIARGVTDGIDMSGALLVRTAHGVERLVAGEVIWA